MRAQISVSERQLHRRRRLGTIDRVRALAASIAINLALLALLARLRAHSEAPRRDQPIEIEMIEARAPAPTPIPPAAPGGGHESHARHLALPHASPKGNDAWSDTELSFEQDGNGGGHGSGSGSGDGNGIGFGAGGEVIAAPFVPRPPMPPPPPPALAVDRGRAAKLLEPAREEEIDEEALFIARVTVDEDGDVVGAHMIRTRPGARGEIAENAIWRFRYAPALDPSGRPMRSTFEQRFQIR